MQGLVEMPRLTAQRRQAPLFAREVANDGAAVAFRPGVVGDGLAQAFSGGLPPPRRCGFGFRSQARDPAFGAQQRSAHGPRLFLDRGQEAFGLLDFVSQRGMLDGLGLAGVDDGIPFANKKLEYKMI
jgi:hypothetical protein